MSFADRQVELLKQYAHNEGMEVIHHGMGHYQVRGGIVIVNYYPFSKGRTMHVDGAKQGVKGALAIQVIKAAKGESYERD